METWSPDKSQPNLITHVKVEAAHESDAHALLPAIKDAAQRELDPKELLADSLYGSDDNVEQARELGVEVISPAMGTTAGNLTLADFTFDATDNITACPTGQKPHRFKVGEKGGRIVHFSKTTCDHCPRQSDCPVQRVKRSVTISYDLKGLRLARRRAKEQTQEFQEVYRYRAGAEGTMSDLDRMMRVKQLRVRGMPQVRVAAVLKATGLNIWRAVAFKNRLRRQKNANEGENHTPNGLICAVKEQFQRSLDCLFGHDNIFRLLSSNSGRLVAHSA